MWEASETPVTENIRKGGTAGGAGDKYDIPDLRYALP